MADRLLLGGFGDELLKLAGVVRPGGPQELSYDRPSSIKTPKPKPLASIGRGGAVGAGEARSALKSLGPSGAPLKTPSYAKGPRPRPKIPKAEGYVPGSVVSGLPKSVMKGSPKGYVSRVGERMKWEAKERKKLPGFLEEGMKRSVKGHPMATPEAVARAKKSDAEAKGLVAGYLKDQPKKKRRGRGRRKKDIYSKIPGLARKHHPMRSLERLVAATNPKGLDPELQKRMAKGRSKLTGGQMRKRLGFSQPGQRVEFGERVVSAKQPPKKQQRKFTMSPLQVTGRQKRKRWSEPMYDKLRNKGPAASRAAVAQAAKKAKGLSTRIPGGSSVRFADQPVTVTPSTTQTPGLRKRLRKATRQPVAMRGIPKQDKI